MAGGAYKEGIPKVRPGVYVNVKNGKVPDQVQAREGITVIPLVGYDWGPKGFVEINAAAPDAAKDKLGRSVYDDNEHMFLIRLALLKASKVYAYIPSSGVAAKATISIGEGDGAVELKVTAMYPGTLGNQIKVISVANPFSGFDVSIYLGEKEVEQFEGISDLETLVTTESAYVAFEGAGALSAFASASLAGGTDAVENGAVAEFLDACEDVVFHAMAFPFTEESQQTAMLSKLQYIRDNMGRKCQAVAPNFAADYEGVINLVNGVVYEGKELTAAQACAFVAGATAGADYTTSNTYLVFPGATGIVGNKRNEEAIESIQKGEMFFSFDETGDVVIEYDINSLVTFTEEKTEEYRKNRVLRVFDSLANELRTTFAPNKFDNNETGWDVMEGIGRTLLSSYEDAGAIQNVDLQADFYIDRGASGGESTYFNVGVQPIDSAEKLYFNVVTR